MIRWRRLLKITFWLLLSLLLLLIGLYFLISSSWAIKNYFGPRIVDYIRLPLSYDRVDFSPRHSLLVYGLRIGEKNKPVLAAKEVRLRFKPWRILFNEIYVDEILVEGGSFDMLQDSQGKWNIPILNEPSLSPPSPVDEEGEELDIPKLALSNLRLKNSRVHLKRAGVGGEVEEELLIGDVDLLLPVVAKPGRAELIFSCRVESHRGEEFRIENAKVKIKGKAEFEKPWLPKSYNLHWVSTEIEGRAPGVLFDKSELHVQLERGKDFGATVDVKRLGVLGAEGAQFVDIRSIARSDDPFRKILSFKEVSIEMLLEQTRTALLKGSASFSPRREKTELAISEAYLDQRFLDLFGVGGSIEALELIGNARATLSKGIDSLEAKGEIVVQKARLRAASPEASAVQGSRLSFDFARGAEGFDLKNIDLFVRKDGEEIGQLGIQGTYMQPQGKSESNLRINSRVFDLYQLMQFLPPSSKPDKEESVEKTAPSEEGNVDLRGLWLRTSFDFEKIVYREAITKSLRGTISVRDSVVDLSELKWNQNGAPVSWAGRVDLKTPGYAYRVKGGLKDLPISPLRKAFAPEVKDGISGKVKSFELFFEGKGLDAESLSKHLVGDLKLVLDKVVLPSKLQDVPPFNIIFLPFSIVIDAGAFVARELVPEDLASLGGATQDAMSESGRLIVEKGVFKLKAENGQVHLEDVRFENNLLPNVRFEGDVAFDKSLDFVTIFSIAGVQLRVPIGGSLDVPLPDMVELAPQLVKGLGLTLINPVVDVFSEKKDDDSEEPDQNDAADSNISVEKRAVPHMPKIIELQRE